MLTVVNKITGKTFNVTLLRKGDLYGLDKCLVHEKEDPLVEFYNTESFSDSEGRFISRYSADSLLGRCIYSGLDISLGKESLCLDGRNPDVFYLTPENCKCVGEWLHSELDLERCMH